MFGDPEADPEIVRGDVADQSHRSHPCPVLVAHGQVDGQVDIRHYRLMTRQLRKHGNEFESFERRFEGTGLIKESNRIAFFETWRYFLARSIRRPQSCPTDDTWARRGPRRIGARNIGSVI